MPDASIGRIVHYVVGAGRSEGKSRGAQIVAVFPQPDGAPPLLNLVVTLDGVNDFTTVQKDANAPYTRVPTDPFILHEWQTSIAHATAVGSPATYPPHTWHWPSGVS